MIADLLTNLKALLKKELEDFRAERPHLHECFHKTETVPAEVYIGGVPDRGKSEDFYPCVVLRWADSEGNENSDSVETEIILCVAADGGPEDLELWTATFTDRVQRLLHENSVLAKKYERQWPVRAGRPDPRRESHKYAAVVFSVNWQKTSIPQSLEGY